MDQLGSDAEVLIPPGDEEIYLDSYIEICTPQINEGKVFSSFFTVSEQFEKL